MLLDRKFRPGGDLFRPLVFTSYGEQWDGYFVINQTQNDRDLELRFSLAVVLEDRRVRLVVAGWTDVGCRVDRKGRDAELWEAGRNLAAEECCPCGYADLLLVS